MGNNKNGNQDAPPPKRKKMDREIYETELLKLQAELVEMQEWIRSTGQRLVVVFEGRAPGRGSSRAGQQGQNAHRNDQQE